MPETGSGVFLKQGHDQGGFGSVSWGIWTGLKPGEAVRQARGWGRDLAWGDGWGMNLGDVGSGSNILHHQYPPWEILNQRMCHSKGCNMWSQLMCCQLHCGSPGTPLKGLTWYLNIPLFHFLLSLSLRKLTVNGNFTDSPDPQIKLNQQSWDLQS